MSARNTLFVIALLMGIICQEALFGAAIQPASGAYPGNQPEESRGDSYDPVISNDGRFVTFVNLADDLTPDTPDGALDVFRFDRKTGKMRLVSDVGLPLVGLRSDVRLVCTSSDGGLVSYVSDAQVIIGSQHRGTTAIVWRDLRVNTHEVPTEPINYPDVWVPVPAVNLQMAADGSIVYFSSALPIYNSDATNYFAGLRYYVPANGNVTNVWLRLPQFSGTNVSPNIPIDANIEVTPNGRFAVWQLGLTPFNPPEGRRLRSEIMLYDAVSDSLTQVSIHGANDNDTYGDSFKPAISDDGRWIVFESRSTNLVANDLNGADRNVFLFDGEARTTTLVNTNSAGTVAAGSVSSGAAISGDGNWTVFFSDAPDFVDGNTSGTGDVFLRDNQTGEIRRVSTQAQWNGLVVRNAIKPIVSNDGEWILYQAPRSGLFLYQRSLNQNALITTDCETDPASMTPDAGLVAFTASAKAINATSSSTARNIYVWSRSSGRVELISKRHASYDRMLPDGDSHLYAGGVSGDGTRYVFRSSARNLSADRPDAYEALWIRDLTLGTNILIAVNDGNFRGSGPRPFSEAVMSGNGRYVAYLSQRTNLPPEGLALNGWDDIFVHDLQTGLNHLVTESRTASFDGSSNAVHLSMSNDGNRLVFTSDATNLSTEPGGLLGIYMWDRASDTIKRMDDPLVGLPGDCVNIPSLISPDGSRVAFIMKDTITGYCLLQIREWSSAQSLTLDPNMSVEAFAWNSVSDQLAMVGLRTYAEGYRLFLHDFESGQTETKPGLSVGFTSRGFNFDRNLSYMAYADVHSWNAPVQIRDIGTGQTFGSSGQTFFGEVLLHGPGITISPDGRFAVFKASLPNFPFPSESEKRMHLRVLDRVNGTISILDRSIDDGSLFDVPPGRFLMAPNVSRVLFESYQPDLVSRDDNLSMDIFAVDLIATDSDNDGMDDAWEMAYFDSLDRDGSGDFDGDGVSDLGEYQAGTVPLNSTSVLSVTDIRFVSTEGRLLSWRSVTGKRYRVQMKPTVDAPAWLDRSDVIAAIGETTSFTDSADAGGELPETRFYRVALVP